MLLVAGMLTLLSTPAMAKDIDWSGYTWQVRDGGGGPGPNNWSADNVRIDGDGALHLKIAKRDGKWSCAELTMTKPLGFGTYDFRTDTHLDGLDDNVVLGFFNYPTPDIGDDGTNEIDIEYATWGGQQKDSGNFTVWPGDAGVKQTTHAFDAAVYRSVHTRSCFEWTERSITFTMYPYCNLPLGGVPEMHQWTFAPDDYKKAVPQHPLPVHINLWLFNGKPPTDDKEVEIIVSAFRYGAAS